MWLDETNHVGVFEPVGCDPDFQRRGLTKVLMVEGLRRLQALGATMAYVSSASEDKNRASNALYARVGFVERDRYRQWAKQPGS